MHRRRGDERFRRDSCTSARVPFRAENITPPVTSVPASRSRAIKRIERFEPSVNAGSFKPPADSREGIRVISVGFPRRIIPYTATARRGRGSLERKNFYSPLLFLGERLSSPYQLVAQTRRRAQRGEKARAMTFKFSLSCPFSPRPTSSFGPTAVHRSDDTLHGAR